MTLRQVLDIIWRRWLLVTVTTLLVVGAAIAYVQLSPKVYESTSVVRFSLAATRMFDGGGGYADTDLELDPDFVTSPALLDVARVQTDDDAGSLQGSIKVELVEGVRTNRLDIKATAETPEQSQLRANAVADTYVTHLAGQVAATAAQLEVQLTEARKERTDAVKQATKKPNDPVAQQRLGDALATVSTLEEDLEDIATSGPPATVLQSALPGKRTGSDATTVLLIGLASGLLAGAGAALIRDLFDDRLRSATAVEQLTGKPVIAELPRIRRHGRQDRTLPVAAGSATQFQEGIRTLRTSLNVLFPDPHSAIAITSPEPGDGKSFISANLAISMSRGGRSVILVGGDMRRPTLDEYFGIAPGPGLSEAINEDLDAPAVAALLHRTDFDRLRLLSAGMSRHEPADLLASTAFAEVVRHLKSMADVVLFDSPPGLALADASVIGALSDGVVVVAAASATTHKLLLHTVHGLHANGAEVAGVVVNRSRRTVPRAYNSYYGATATPEESTAPEVAVPPDSAFADFDDENVESTVWSASAASPDLDLAEPQDDEDEKVLDGVPPRPTAAVVNIRSTRPTKPSASRG
ncbi:MAG TPA: P-loop NTPase [Actinomycetota bacterium]|nr:P-loop NTPase [Actinomycetota bacterium]